ncbi:MAG: nucleotide exchange factor GrpE [Promethearchaeota archaeon]
MVDKKKMESKKEQPSQSNNEAKEKGSETEESNIVEKKDTKLIEGEEPRKLEYFSKEELVEKLNMLEKDIKEKEKSLSQFQAQAKDWKDKYMRLQAEFENAHKRWEKNRQNLHLQYTASTLKSFLPLYDSYKKALEGNNPHKDILKGFYDQFMNILKFYKAEPIKVNIGDPFDYNYHEAVSTIEKNDVPSNTIIDIIQDGWKLDKEVIRYAKVVIAREPKPPEPEPEPEPELAPEQETKQELEQERELKPEEKKEEGQSAEKTRDKEKDSDFGENTPKENH